MQHVAGRGADRRLGKAAERRYLLLQIPHAGHIGDSRQERDAAPGNAQPAHQRRPIFAVFGTILGRGDDFLERRLCSVRDDPGQELPLGDGDAAEKRAVAKERVEQRFARAAGAPRPGARREMRVGGGGESGVPGVEAQLLQTPVGGPRQPSAIPGEVR